MKKWFFLLLLAGLVMSVPANAQFFTQMSLMTPHYYPGEVYFTDGHHEAFEEVELPRVSKSRLGVKVHADDKRTYIDAIDIVAIKIWHKNFPDKVHTIYYVQAKKAMMQDDNMWGTPIAGSDWGVLYKCEMNYEIDKKTGELNIVKFVGGNGPDTPTLYYLKRPEWTEAQLLLWNGGFCPSKKKAAVVFKENLTIYDAIKSGKLGPSDMQYILDEMAGGKKPETPEQAVPQVLTDTISNGVAGDDE